MNEPDQPRRAVTPSRGPAPGQDDPERSGRRTTRRSRMPLWLDTVVSNLTPEVFDLNRGDVVVFEYSADWNPGDATEDPTPRVRLMMVLSMVCLAPDPSQDHLVKRLIGMLGDRVVCEDVGAQLEVNGVALEEG